MIAHKERFEEKVCPEPNTGCHLWTASSASHGYGQFKLNGKHVLSHRVAYELYVGPIPEGMYVCHTCDVRVCVNPEHLFLGTHADNMKDRNGKGRQARGEDHGCARLTEELALEIYHAAGTQIEITKKYGVSRSLVSKIKNKKKWSHIHDEA